MRTRQPAPRVPAVCRPPCAEEETEAGSSSCHTVQAHERDSAGPRPWHGVHVAGVPRRPHCALAGGEPAFATSPGLRLGVYLHQVSGSRGLGLLDAAASGPGGPAGRQRVCWPCSGTQAAITQAALGSRRSSSHPSRSRGGARGAACARQPARPGRSERPSARARRLRCVRLRVSRRRTCVHARKGTRRAPEAAVTPPGHLCALCFACSVTRGARVSARGVASPRVPGRRRAGAGPPPPRPRLGRRPACASASRRSARPELVRLFPGKGEREGAGARRRREGDPAGSAQARASRDAPCRSPVRKRRARTSPRGPGGSDPGRGEFTLPRCGASE